MTKSAFSKSLKRFWVLNLFEAVIYEALVLSSFVEACKRGRINSGNKNKTRQKKSHKHKGTFFNSMFTHDHFHTAADRHTETSHTDSAHQRRHRSVHPDDALLPVPSGGETETEREREGGKSRGWEGAGWVLALHGWAADEGPSLSCCDRLIQTYSRAGSANEPTWGRQLGRRLTHLQT